MILPHVDFSEYASVLSVASHAVERFKGRGWYLTNTETEQYVVNSEMNFRYIQFIMNIVQIIQKDYMLVMKQVPI